MKPRTHCHAMKTIFTAILLLAAPFAHATLTWSQTFTISNPALNGAIPDGNPSGIYFDGAFNLANAGDRVLGVSVGLDLSGGYNGDLYAYLSAPDGTMVVLMNQPGMDAFGAGGAGMHIMLQAGTSDHGSIQSAGDGYLSGSYNPAGNLTSFGSPGSPGGSANGTWSLYFADLSSGGGTAQLNAWTLGVTVVPEPVPLALGLFATLLLARGCVKWALGHIRVKVNGQW